MLVKDWWCEAGELSTDLWRKMKICQTEPEEALLFLFFFGTVPVKPSVDLFFVLVKIDLLFIDLLIGMFLYFCQQRLNHFYIISVVTFPEKLLF